MASNPSKQFIGKYIAMLSTSGNREQRKPKGENREPEAGTKKKRARVARKQDLRSRKQLCRCKNSNKAGRQCDLPKQFFVEDGHDKIKWQTCNVLRVIPVDSGGGGGSRGKAEGG